MKRYWPLKIYYKGEPVYKFKSSPSHAFYILPKQYMNRSIVIDKHHLEKWKIHLEKNLNEEFIYL